MKGSLYLSIALFLILITIFITNNDFFTSLYNSKVGRLILVIILIIITINSLLLAILLLIIVIVLSQNKKRVTLKVVPPEEEEKQKLSLAEVLYKENKERPDEKFMYKKYNNYQYKKSKRKNGVNVVQLSETIRPKPSKYLPLFPNSSNNEIIPFSQTSFYKI
jgi:hypothetical protein